jgi:hypothetical protein
MKKILHYFKIILSLLVKTLKGAILGMALGMGLGKNVILEKKKDNKTISAKK